MIKKSHLSEGFTLIELLVVILIISVLSGVVLGVLNSTGVQGKARDSQRQSDLKKVQVALEAYFADNRVYPISTGAWKSVKNISELNSYLVPLPSDPSSDHTGGNPCTAKAGYLYSTNTVTASLAAGSAYVLTAGFEVNSTKQPNQCNTLYNCTGATPIVPGCGGTCGAPCYGVQNP